jgi:CHAT domain-containing protein
MNVRNPEALKAIRRDRPSAELLSGLSILYQQLIAPLQLADDVQTLVISPDEHLFGLPWAALRDPEGRWLVNRYAIVSVPSLSTIAGARRQRASAVGENHVALLIGALGGVDSSESSGVEAQGKALAPLLYGDRELQSVAKAFSPHIVRYLLGETALSKLRPRPELASKEKVLEALPSAGWVHVVAHGLFYPADPMNATLFVAGKGLARRLMAREILNLDLRRVSLVTLAACQTGEVGSAPGDEPVGFTRALLGAGVKDVVLTEWEVDDFATEEIMTRSYSLLKRRGVVAALNEAVKSLSKEHSHPYFWAGISVQGDWVNGE